MNIMINSTTYEMIRETTANARDLRHFFEERCWIVSVFVVSNGQCFGVAYNQNGWYNDNSPDYEFILDCKWNHINFIYAEHSGYIVAFSADECHIFSLMGFDISHGAEDRLMIIPVEISNLNFEAI